MRLMQKFKKISDAFRHFDRDYDNQISYKEFRVVCEEMDMRYTKNELQIIYSYLDDDGGGTIGFLEFTKLLDEKRMGIDPYTNQLQDK
jgi:Ca2+-binding EF-hand superfamily protein